MSGLEELMMLLGGLGGFGGMGRGPLDLAMDREKLDRAAAKATACDDAKEALMDGSNPKNRLLLAATDAEYKERNFKKAKMLYEQAIKEDEHPLAYCNYALWYQQGTRPGCPKDLRKARELYEKAAEAGVGMAMVNMALMYQRGEGGLKKDLKKAFQLARESLKDDRHTTDSLVIAFDIMGKARVDGKGCAQSHKAALRCLEYASYFGGPRAWMEYAEPIKMLRTLSKIHPAAVQTETDKRYDSMAHAIDQMPEDEKPKTYAGWLAVLDRFGFHPQSRRKLPKNLNKPCTYPEFLEVSTPWNMLHGWKPPEGGLPGCAQLDEADEDELKPATASSSSSSSKANKANNSSSNGGGDNQASGSGSNGGGDNQASGSGSNGGGDAAGGEKGADDGVNAAPAVEGNNGDGAGAGGGIGKGLCGYCRKTNASKRCGRCRQAYCSRECQQADWREGHKQVCDIVRANMCLD